MADAERSFPDPFAIETPPGAEGWERLYPYYYLFSDDRRVFDRSKFWFFDQMHNPEPVYPFDTIMVESWLVALNQYTTRVWLVPPALGIDQRIVNGYLYLSPNVITDPDVVAERAEHFRERAGYYFEHWDELYEAWIKKAEDCIQRLEAMQFSPLPEREPMETITSGRGTTSSFDLLVKYSRLLENMHEMAYYHFEMLNLGYGAYLTLLEFCQNAFPGIGDQTVARMVAGIDILFFRPDDELRKLAKLAIQLGVADAVKKDGSPDERLEAIAAASNGDQWLAALEGAKEPWFWYSTGPGYCHQHRAWIDDLRVPFQAIVGYIEKLEAGESIDRPLEQLREERERIFEEYRELLVDEDDKVAFTDLVQLSRKVFPFVENHNFYVEHWHHSLFWSKVREVGDVLVDAGFLEDREDVFLLHRYELYSALYEVQIGWATCTPTRGPSYWPEIVRERKRTIEALAAWEPPPALGVPPEQVTEPFTIMLWGITSETIENWLGGDGSGDADTIRGFAGSPGLVEGVARVIRTVEELDEVQTGEILVCPLTAPSWSPVFARIKAAVSDGGGIMSHAAIVSREYGLPAVVGTGYATQRIRTGQRLRVDGSTGVVTIL
ncbi:MAG: PEP-utilizing enzyme [Acidimicrobiia bacterium]|nr:PEP-utilizing enzyme [Acidimicrobiia bacterium]